MESTMVSHSIKNEVKQNLSVSIPLIASQMVASLTGFVGTAMIARLGTDALAASIIIGMMWATVSFSFMGALNAISVLVSHQHGADNHLGVSEIMGQGYLLGIIMSVLLALLLLTFPYVIRLTAQPENVLRLADQYTFSLFWTVPGLMMLIISEQFLIGISRTKLVLRISLLVVPLEILMVYLLVYGKFGLPVCGLAGIGYGFAVSYTLTSIFLITYLMRSRLFDIYKIFSRVFCINPTYFKEILRVGIPMGLMHVIEIGAFSVATFWIARFGTTQVAAHQIAIQFLGFMITIVFAMSQSVTVRVGMSVGRLDIVGVRYAAFTGMGMNFIFMVFVMLAFVFFPTFFIRLDLNIYKPANFLLVENASALIAITGVLMLFDNFRIISFGVLRGIKDTGFPMLASFLAFWVVGLSCSYYFGFILNKQDKGIWWGLTIGIAVGAVILLARIRVMFKRVDLKQVLALSR